MVGEDKEPAIAELVTVPEAARLLGMSEQGILKRIQRKAMRAERLGGKVWVIPRAEVERWRRLGKQRPGRKPRGDAGEPRRRDHPPGSIARPGDAQDTEESHG